MDGRGKDGVPRRIHLEKIAASFIPTPDSIEAINELDSELPLPELSADAWVHYKQLDNRRRWLEGEPQRFLWVDIEAYINVTGIRLGRWYLKTIFALEDAFFEARAEAKS